MPELANRTELENDLSGELALLLREFVHSARRSFDEFRDDLVGILAGTLAIVFEDSYRTLMDQWGIPVLGSGISSTALAWATRYSRTLANYLFGNASTWLDSVKELTAAALAAFILNRAVAIAVTEITRTVSRGEREAARQVHDSYGWRVVAFWNTEPGACPICFPLHRKPEWVWQWKYGIGPPIHVRCRCWLTWERLSYASA